MTISESTYPKWIVKLKGQVPNDYIAESEEEYYYALWIQQLIEAEYILSARRPKVEELVRAAEYKYNIIKGKLKPKNKKVTISRQGKYTGDMSIIWAEKARGVFFLGNNDNVITDVSPLSKSGKNYYFHWANENNYSFVDVKGTGLNPKFHSSSSFDRIQQLLFLKFDIPLQKIIPFGKKGLFAKTFVPDQYMYTPTGKIKEPVTWVLKTFDTFINEHINILSEFNSSN